MNSRPQPANSLHAFTLIELLTVITIIAILMGLLFPAVGIVKDQARKAQAKADVTGIAAAVRQYYTEYGKYPIGSNSPSAGQDLVYGDTINNFNLFDILRNIGSPNPYNPRAIVFFDGRSAADAVSPKGGFATQDTQNNIKKGDFIDPWGQPYRIAVDSDYDNLIKPSGTFYNDFQNDNAPRTGVCVWSVGKDGILGDKTFQGNYRQTGTNGKLSDDVISWQ